MAAEDIFCKIFVISGITMRTCHSLVGSTVVDQRHPKTKGSALIVYQGPIRVFVKKNYIQRGGSFANLSSLEINFI